MSFVAGMLVGIVLGAVGSFFGVVFLVHASDRAERLEKASKRSGHLARQVN
jgi:type II secretory pathway component PulJ